MRHLKYKNPLLFVLGLAFLSGCLGELGSLPGEGEADDEIFEEIEPGEPPVLSVEEPAAFYWYEGQKMELSQSTTRRAVRYSKEATPQNRQHVAAALNVEAGNAEVDLGNGIFLYPVSKNPKSMSMNALALDEMPADAKELAVFELDFGNAAILTEEFNAQFKPEVTKQQIDEFNANNKVSIVSPSTWEANAFILAVQEDAGVDALTMANRYYESGLTTYASPNFVQLIERAFVPNDPLFPQQWGLNNTAQGGKGIVGKDIRAVSAWDRTRGSSTITIAIIDEGVDYAHPDLNTSGKLVTGYDAMLRRDNPNPVKASDRHGTACAGIAAAAGHNSLGISGVAPNSRIMGVRIAEGTGLGGWITTESAIADGIATAANRGASVLSNSWGGGSPSSVITNAIRHAKTNGRGGKGAVVVFATGNNNGAVSYPANLPEVFAVAACNQWGERKSPTSRDGESWWGSNFGPQVDVCAPGVSVHTTTNSAGYISNFNGTSAATPHVAGVAALVLSLNPNLTAAQVEQILRNSADDIAPAGRDDFTGYGFVNALRAVQAVPADAFVRLPVSTWAAPPAGGSISLQVTTNQPSWTATSSDSSWLTFSPSSGVNGTWLLVSAAPNNTGSVRIGTVTLRAGNATPFILTVTQAAMPVPVCTLSVSSVTIPQLGGTLLFSASCTNSPYPSGYVWTVDGVRQSSTGNMLSYTFSRNDSSLSRLFTIGVTASNGAGISNRAERTLPQAGLAPAPVPICSFNMPSANIAQPGGYYYISVWCTNAPISHTWTVNGLRQTGTGSTILYYFPPNTTGAARTFDLRVFATNQYGAGNTAQLPVYQAR